MKTAILVLTFALNIVISFGQTGEDEKAIQKIKKQVEDQIPYQRAKILADDQYTNDIALEFELDTFRLERMNDLRQENDYSSPGMISAITEHTAGYDKLMNKYYNLLKSKLKPKDKAALTSAQKAWVSFRDKEEKVLKMMQDTTYSGNGAERIFDYYVGVDSLVQQRATELYQYYVTIIEEEPLKE
jgi:uncharacterized protein YecT (DUF1311 family)